MENKKHLYVLGLFIGFILSVHPSGWAQSKPEMKRPLITHAFATETAHYGTLWKIYIEAEDPNGDMLRIVSVVDQVGYGRYPAQGVYLKPQYGKHFRGYLQGNFNSKTTAPLNDWTQITLKVSVFDKAGNESNEVVFRLTFLSGGGSLPSLPAPFDQGDNPRLGYINFDLRNPGGTY
jgi:hypothetical protein